MPQAAWYESQIWLAAGWTMFRFLGIGVLLWILAAVLRWTLRRSKPQVRYVAALALLSAAAAIPMWLFIAAPDMARNRPEGARLAAVPSILTANVELRPELGQYDATNVSREQSRNDEKPSIGSASLPAPVAWQSAFTSGLNRLQEISCRWLPWLWLTGTPLALLVLACGVTGTGHLRRAGRLIDEHDLIAAGERLRAALGIGRYVAIVACDRVAAPILTGIVWPAILLPPAVLAGCSPEQIEMILLHELAHVRRWDNLVNFAQRVVEAVLFFHPVVWWLSSWARLEREECCDQVVVAHTGMPQEYAEILAALALPGITPRHAAAAMTDSHLVTRIRHILKLEDETMHVSRKAFVAAAVFLVVAGSFAASFAQQSKDKTPRAAAAGPADGTVNRVRISGELLGDQQTAEAELLGAVKATYLQDLGQLLAQQAVTETWEARNLEELAAEISSLPPGALSPVYLAFDQGAEILTTLNPTSATRYGLATLLGQAFASQPKWGPEQAAGAPNSPDWPNNQGTAWCPATADGQEEWLELTYAEPVEPLVLVVYECLKPGALTRVVAFDAEGNEINAWSGKDPSPPDSGNGSAISVIPLKVKKIKIVRLRLYLDSPHVEGWNEIDAAGILDVKGVIHWATGATASSTWVDQSSTTAAALSAVSSEPQTTTAGIELLRGLAVSRVLDLRGFDRAGSSLIFMQDAGKHESDEDKELKATLLALAKQSWDAAAKMDATVDEKLLADDYFGFYVNSSGYGRGTKASTIAAVKRRRYSDVSLRDAEARRIGRDAAILTYVYDCKVEEAGEVWTYRNHQATQLWTQKDGRWLLNFSQDFILPSGE